MEAGNMPSPAVLSAHTRSSYHRAEVERSEVCGCFHCLAWFRPARVAEWIDGGQTALCPLCGIDSVLGSASSVSLSAEFLAEMRAYWFSL